MWGLRAAAGMGVPEAMFKMGQALMEGKVVSRNRVEALSWFERAGDAGHQEAQNAAGAANLALGCPAAAQWFERAAVRGHPLAQCNLGVLYAQALFVTQDHQVARQWFERSANQGCAEGQYNLALVYAKGFGVRRNLAMAHALCTLAASQGHFQAIDALPKFKRTSDSDGNATIQRMEVPRGGAEVAEGLCSRFVKEPVVIRHTAKLASWPVFVVQRLLHASGRRNAHFEVQAVDGDERPKLRDGTLAEVLRDVGASGVDTSGASSSEGVFFVSEEALSSLGSCFSTLPLTTGKWPEGLRPAAQHALVAASAKTASSLFRCPMNFGSWHLAVLGSQCWRLFPPPPTVDKALLTRFGGGSSSASFNDAPPFCASHTCVVRLMAGEVLVVPPGWWQQSYQMEPSVSVTSEWIHEGAMPEALAIAASEAGFRTATFLPEDAAAVAAEVTRRGLARPDRRVMMRSAAT